MSLWAWVLVGLAAAGLILALLSVVPVLVLAQRLRKRVRGFQNSRLAISLMSLRLQTNRLARSAEQLRALVSRGGAAVTLTQTSIEHSGVVQVRDCAQEAGTEISALLSDLR